MAGSSKNGGPSAHATVIAATRIPTCTGQRRDIIPLRHSPKLQPVTIDVIPDPHIKMALDSGRAANGHGVGLGSPTPVHKARTASKSKPHP